MTAHDEIIREWASRPGRHIVNLSGGKDSTALAIFLRDKIPQIIPPDVLDVTRTPNPHLGFGAGIHYCVGAPLARVEIAAALTALITRMPRLRLAEEPSRRPEFVIRGLRTLRVSGE